MTGSAGRYAELAAAVRSYKAELTHRDQIERIIESGSLSEAVGQLTRGQLALADSDDLAPVETFLMQRVISMATSLSAYAPYDSRSLIRLLSQRYEFDCIKQVLKCTIEQMEPEEALRNISPAGRFTADKCKELIEARNPNRVIDALADDGLKQITSSKLSEKNARATVAAVDQYYYRKLWATSNLPDPLDAQSARGLIGQFIDHLNVLLALRAKLVGLDSRTTSEMMIPINYGLGKAFTEVAEASSFANAMRVMDKTPYSTAFQNLTAAEGITVGVERALHSYHAQSCLTSFAGSPFNVGLALALLFLKNYELHDLLSVINGKANNLASDRITASLIL
jgi:V/A-type H+-transporting ATPase subunit C